MKRRYKELGNRAWLYQKYWTEELNLFQIAEMLGCNSESVRKALKKADINRRTRAEQINRKAKYKQIDRNWLNQKYHQEKLSSNEIARILGCDGKIVLKALKYFDLPIHANGELRKGKTLTPEWKRKIGEAGKNRCKYMLLSLKEELNDAYWNKKHSSCEIAQMIGCTPEAVIRALRKFDIPRRTRSEARRLQKMPKSNTKPERIFIGFYKKFGLENQVVDTRSNSFRIGRLNPDFIIRDMKKAIFVNGDYWHSPLLKYNVRETQRVDCQIKECKKHKWKAIILWESDLKREDAEVFVLLQLKKEGIL